MTPVVFILWILQVFVSIWQRDSHFRNSDLLENSISEEGKMQGRVLIHRKGFRTISKPSVVIKEGTMKN
jgi:hypothetical protein